MSVIAAFLPVIQAIGGIVSIASTMSGFLNKPSAVAAPQMQMLPAPAAAATNQVSEAPTPEPAPVVSKASDVLTDNVTQSAQADIARRKRAKEAENRNLMTLQPLEVSQNRVSLTEDILGS